MSIKKKITELAIVSALILPVSTVFTSANVSASVKVPTSNWEEIHLKSGKSMKILPDNASRMSGKVSYDGQIYSYKFLQSNGKYTLYLNGIRVISIDITNSQISSVNNNYTPFFNFTYANGKVAFRHDGRKYYYLTTEKYDGDTLRRLDNATRDIILGLAGFIPVVGPYITAGSIGYTVYEDIFGKQTRNKWYTVKEYCTRGYEYYAWKTYTYSDSSRKHLESVRWEFKKVL